MPKKIVNDVKKTATNVKNTVEDVVEKARDVVEQAPVIEARFRMKRSLIERLGVKNPVVSAILAGLATAAVFFFGG